jgi:hypothetical protein
MPPELALLRGRLPSVVDKVSLHPLCEPRDPEIEEE